MKSTVLDTRSRTDATSQTDDQRIKDITVLPPPEHLIRFFPIQGTPVEKLVSDTRKRVREIVDAGTDRARKTAQATMVEVRAAMGLNY